MSRRTAQDIDKNLRAAFEDVASQAVPDRFIELLAKLRAAEEKAAEQRENGGDSDG